MNIITKLPGPLLVFLGACSLSFGGLIVKSFEGATLWQILFWRSLFFSLTVLVFLIISYRQKTLKAFKAIKRSKHTNSVTLFHWQTSLDDKGD